MYEHTTRPQKLTDKSANTRQASKITQKGMEGVMQLEEKAHEHRTQAELQPTVAAAPFSLIRYWPGKLSQQFDAAMKVIPTPVNTV